VCHGASPAVAATILRDGRLLSAVRVAGATTGAVRQSEWGEPADYFEHVMFANGRCTAPEAVAASRTLGRDLVPADLAPGYTPAVRFFFRWEELVARGDARFDGVHPVKIRGELSLADVLAAVVVHAGAARIVEEAAPAALAERVVVLGAERPSPGEWATAALHAARALA
jgi:hypothetical protein